MRLVVAALLSLAACAHAHPAVATPGPDSAAATGTMSAAAPATTQRAMMAAVTQDVLADLGAVLPDGFSEMGEPHIPGVLVGRMGYGQDTIFLPPETAVVVSQSPGVMAPHAGGEATLVLNGSSAEGQPEDATFQHAKALFDAMARATETSQVDGDLTTTTRSTPHGLVVCERVASKDGTSYHCTIKGLLSAGVGDTAYTL